MASLKHHTVSVKHAFDGIIYTLKTQPNFQVHLFFTILAVSSGFILHISRVEWSVIIFVIGLVLTTEMINTSLESIVDLLTSEYHEKAKVAKDVAAGLVLVNALIAVVTGLLIFLPHII